MTTSDRGLPAYIPDGKGTFELLLQQHNITRLSTDGARDYHAEGLFSQSWCIDLCLMSWIENSTGIMPSDLMSALVDNSLNSWFTQDNITEALTKCKQEKCAQPDLRSIHYSTSLRQVSKEGPARILVRTADVPDVHLTSVEVLDPIESWSAALGVLSFHSGHNFITIADEPCVQELIRRMSGSQRLAACAFPVIVRLASYTVFGALMYPYTRTFLLHTQKDSFAVSQPENPPSPS